MNEAIRRRLFGFEEALQDRFTLSAVGAVVAILVLSFVAIFVLRRLGRIADKSYIEVMLRWRSWLFLSAILFAPVLLGPAWVMAAVCLLSLLCYREFARATGLFRDTEISVAVVFGILLVTFSIVDNFSRLFFACSALGVGIIAIVSILRDKPHGYLQRTALGVFGFLLFGYCLGYIGYFANSPIYRSILILIVMSVELNDVFAFCCGKLIGGPKAIPNTSPGKTWAGCLGAFVLTTAFVATLGHFAFAGTVLDHPGHLLFMGASLSVLGQFGDLLLSSIKRDVGIKDIGHIIPGHGGLLDRFDSLVLVPPAAFHYLSLTLGPIGADQPMRIISGGG